MGNNSRYGLHNPPRSEYESHGLRKPPGMSAKVKQQIEDELYELSRMPAAGGRKHTHTLWARYPSNSFFYFSDERNDSTGMGRWRKVRNYDSAKAGEQGLLYHRDRDNILKNCGAEFKLCNYGDDPNNTGRE